MNVNEEYEIANRPLTDEELEQFKPIEQVLPKEMLQMFLDHEAQRQKEKKEVVTIRLSAEILRKFRATGKGWQTRINDVLLKHVEAM